MVYTGLGEGPGQGDWPPEARDEEGIRRRSRRIGTTICSIQGTWSFNWPDRKMELRGSGTVFSC
jgi:hypothetical protein